MPDGSRHDDEQLLAELAAALHDPVAARSQPSADAEQALRDALAARPRTSDPDATSLHEDAAPLGPGDDAQDGRGGSRGDPARPTDGGDGGPGATPVPLAARRRTRGRRAGRDRRTAAVAAAAAAVALVVGAAGASLLGSDDTEAVVALGTVEYSGPLVGPQGTGVGELDVVETGIGRAVRLQTDELPILPTGEYYEVWFVGPDDAPGSPDRISAGTFHPAPDGSTDVRFAAAVDPDENPLVEVTAEGDGDPAVTGPVVLRAELR